MAEMRYFQGLSLICHPQPVTSGIVLTSTWVVGSTIKVQKFTALHRPCGAHITSLFYKGMVPCTLQDNSCATSWASQYSLLFSL